LDQISDRRTVFGLGANEETDVACDIVAVASKDYGKGNGATQTRQRFVLGEPCGAVTKFETLYDHINKIEKCLNPGVTILRIDSCCER